MTIWMLWTVVFTLLVGLAALALERAAGYLRAPQRFVWLGALAVSIVVPGALALRQAPREPASPATVRAVEAVVSAATFVELAPLADANRAVQRVAVRSAPADRWAAIGWAVLSVCALLGFARAAWSLRTRRRSWRRASIDGADVLIARDAGPAVVGFVRPIVVMPEWALTLSPNDHALMLRHELEHVRAHDERALLGAGVALVACPWNAPLWWMVRRLRLAIELDCDARVVRGTGAALEYGHLLLSVGERLAARLPLAVSLSGPHPLLARRIHAMTTQRPRRPLRAATPLAVCAFFALALAAAAPRPASLASIVDARGPQEYPTRDSIKAIIAAQFPEIVSGELAASFVVLILDANNNYVRGLPGTGSVVVQVAGDPRTPAERNSDFQHRSAAGRFATANADAGQHLPVQAAGGGGRGGRAGGSSGRAAQAVPATDGASVAFWQKPNANPRYATGVFSSGTSPVDGSRVSAPVNASPGFEGVNGNADLSGIVGLPASVITSADPFSFGIDEQLGPRALHVIVVTTNQLRVLR